MVVLCCIEQQFLLPTMPTPGERIGCQVGTPAGRWLTAPDSVPYQCQVLTATGGLSFSFRLTFGERVSSRKGNPGGAGIEVRHSSGG